MNAVGVLGAELAAFVPHCLATDNEHGWSEAGRWADGWSEAGRWADSGAMWLTGRADGPPLAAPPGLITRLADVGSWLGVPGLDCAALLAERAAITGMYRNGRTSVGGRCRLMSTSDAEWIAVSLARVEDQEAVPAWLGTTPGRDLWGDVESVVGRRPAVELMEQGMLLGLPISLLGEYSRPEPAIDARSVGVHPTTSTQNPVVVDLSSLWAGPLCAHLLGLQGATVVKVESVHRPDGARRGPQQFYDLLHSGHRSVAVDFRTARGIEQLLDLLMAADVVIEASRPRALEQLGIEAEQLVSDGGPQVWASITAYGRHESGRDRVGFGDDAAVAGGLVAWEHGEPRFCADAIADPLAGIVAAAAVTAALASGRRWLLDIPLAGVAAWMAGSPSDRGRRRLGPDPEGDSGEHVWAGPVARPRARRPVSSAPAIGADDGELLTRCGD